MTGLDIGSKKVFYIEPGDFVLNIVFAWEGAVAVTSDAEAGVLVGVGISST
jgi:type I restriction enzyme S subunit